MTTIDFINANYKVDELGASAKNWGTGKSAKTDCADGLENNHSQLSLPGFTRYLFSFKNGMNLLSAGLRLHAACAF